MLFDELNQELRERLNSEFNKLTKKLEEKGAEIDIITDMRMGGKTGKAFYIKYQGEEADVFISIDQEGNLHREIFNEPKEIIKDLLNNN